MQQLRPPTRRAGLLAVSLMSVALLAVTAPACTDDSRATGEPTARSRDDAEKVLMSLSGTSATATAPATGPSAGGEQIVTLPGATDVLVFTDRPERQAARVAIRRFVAAWPKVFTGDPPNAVITGTLPDGTRTQLAVEIRGANVAGEVPSFRVHGIGADRGREVPAALGQASLFIDDATIPGCGPIGEGPQAQTTCSVLLVYANTFVPFDSSF